MNGHRALAGVTLALALSACGGRIVPVDGGYTMALEAMVRVVERLRSSVIIPMHWFSGYSLDQFLDNVSGSFAIDRRDGPEMVVNLRDLPSQPTVVVLQPQWLSD